MPPCVVWFASGYACVPACTNEADEGRAMQRTGRWYTRCPVACSRHQRLLGAKSGIPRCSEWAHTLRYPRACLTAPAGQQGSHQLRGQRFLPKMCVTWAHLLKNDPGKRMLHSAVLTISRIAPRVLSHDVLIITITLLLPLTSTIVITIIVITIGPPGRHSGRHHNYDNTYYYYYYYHYYYYHYYYYYYYYCYCY